MRRRGRRSSPRTLLQRMAQTVLQSAKGETPRCPETAVPSRTVSGPGRQERGRRRPGGDAGVPPPDDVFAHLIAPRRIAPMKATRQSITATVVLISLAGIAWLLPTTATVTVLSRDQARDTIPRPIQGGFFE